MNSGRGIKGSALGNGRRALAEEVPVGYKRTEVGVIPEDWSVFSIDELFDYLRTASNSRADLGDTGVVAYVHYGDIHTRFHHFIDFSRDNVPRLLAGKSVTATRLRDGDLIVADASEDEAGVGKSVEVRNLGTIEAVSGLHTFLLRSKNRRVHDGYRGYLLEKEPVRGQLRRLATGLKVFGISKQALRDVRIPLPPLSEQRAIAEALSDVDGMLAALEALISKKRAVKQAAMQQLLTGESRLPGFSGAWETKRIGDFTDCTAGGTPSTLIFEYWGGTIRWMNSGELNNKIVHDVEGRITERGLRESSTKIVPPQCVLIGLAGQGKTRGTVAINTVELCTNQSIAAIYPNDSFVPEYLYYNLDARYEELRGMSTGDGGRGGLNLQIILSIAVPFPRVDEQTAIATVLSDMDAEIAVLERRRDKAHVVKQGMMQQLLTGKVRLLKLTRTMEASAC